MSKIKTFIFDKPKGKLKSQASDNDKKIMSINLYPEQIKKLQKESIKKDMSISQLVRFLIDKHIK